MKRERRQRGRLGARWLSAALLVSCGCQTELPGGPPPLRNWLRVQASAFDRDVSSGEDVQDAGSFGIVSGYDFVSSPARLGLELDINYSSHDIDDVAFGGGHAHLDVWRIGFGARVGTDLIPYRLGVHARGGGFFAAEEDLHVDGIAEDGSGYYYGAGLDFWFDGAGHFGPFVTVWERDEDGITEVQIGLGASFQF